MNKIVNISRLQSWKILFIKKFKLKLKVYSSAFTVFVSTFLAIYLIQAGINSIKKNSDKKIALEKVTHKSIKSLDVVEEPHEYERTVQTWFVPPHEKWLSPISWLKYSENCIFSGRLNAMKYAGMIPGDWGMKDFIKRLEGVDYVTRWGLHTGKTPLTDKIIDEINRKVNRNTDVKYKWYSIKNMDELIYLAKKGHHVFVYTQVWLGPSKRYPKPVLYNNMNFAHACTITGIKSYDPGEDVFEFEIYETLPFSMLTLTPVYSKVKKKGVNLFDRQSVPYIFESGDYSRSGYIIVDKKGLLR